MWGGGGEGEVLFFLGGGIGLRDTWALNQFDSGGGGGGEGKYMAQALLRAVLVMRTPEETWQCLVRGR